MLTVLVVDDWPQVASAVRRELMREFSVQVATSSAEAMAAAAQKLPDAAVIDVLLPGTNGLELAAELRRRGFTGPVIFISTSTEPELPGKISALAPSRLLSKPWGNGEVLRSVQELLAR